MTEQNTAMIISIGIFAYQEEGRIGAMLESLFEQTVFTSPTESEANIEWHLHIIPNGCTDKTAEVARTAITLGAANSKTRIATHINVIDKPGKSNAWNIFIHEISSSKTDLFFFFDADIFSIENNIIRAALACFASNEKIAVVVNTPTKRFTPPAPWNPLVWLSKQASRGNEGEPSGLCGHFYASRAALLRDIWVPIGLSVDDGFIYNMIVTRGFRSSPDTSLVHKIPNTTDYEGLTDLSKVINHEVRIVIGTIFNCYICWDTLKYVTPENGPGAGILIRDLNKANPNWYNGFIENAVQARNGRIISRELLFRRLTKPKTSFKSWVFSVLAFFFDLVVFARVLGKIRKRKAIGIW